MDKKPPTIKIHNAEDEAAIQRALADDNDSWEAPKLAKVLRRGCPTGSSKSQITIKLDKDIIRARLRAANFVVFASYLHNLSPVGQPHNQYKFCFALTEFSTTLKI